MCHSFCLYVMSDVLLLTLELRHEQNLKCFHRMMNRWEELDCKLSSCTFVSQLVGCVDRAPADWSQS